MANEKNNKMNNQQYQNAKQQNNDCREQNMQENDCRNSTGKKNQEKSNKPVDKAQILRRLFWLPGYRSPSWAIRSA